MRLQKPSVIVVFAATLGVFQWIGAQKVFAHCDTLDGPVVAAARTALEKGDVTPVLKWVKKEHEPEIREAFERTLAVREKGDEARELADRYFFETLVRVHRAGEGAPFTGLAPAGSIEPPIAAADKALESGSVEELADKVAQAVRDAIRKRFALAREKSGHAEDSVEAGREFVEAYVEYVHFVEAVHNVVSGESAHQHAEGSGSRHGDH